MTQNVHSGKLHWLLAVYGKWLPFICIVRVLREKVERCCISFPKEAQWNWLMLINDLWCQSFQGLFAYSQNSTRSRNINICTSVKLSLLLSLQTYHSTAVQITMHVVQITVTYAVCWLAWANSLNHPCLGTFVVFVVVQQTNWIAEQSNLLYNEKGHILGIH